MKIPHGLPDFDNGLTQLWFDEMVKKDNKDRYYKIKFENQLFWWYSNMNKKWFGFEDYFGTPQKDILIAYNKWMDKKILGE